MSDRFFKAMIVANVIGLFLAPLWGHFVGQWAIENNWAFITGVYVAAAPNFIILMVTLLGPLYFKREN